MDSATMFHVNLLWTEVALVLLIMTLLYIYVFVVIVARPTESSFCSPSSIHYDNDQTTTPPPPGPRGFPVLGSLHLLAKYSNPWEAFVNLRLEYGDVFRIVLGGTECVVVSSLDTIKEVLLQKADRFSGRPNFLRFHALFGGSRDRSLALCDWSRTQKLRRRLAMPYVFPRPHSDNADTLEAIIDCELQEYFQSLSRKCCQNVTTTFDKTYFSQVTANIFFTYFCTRSYSYEDDYFRKMVQRFDAIFHNINDGFALDFMPWLLPFYSIHLYRLYNYGQFIRGFLVNTLISGWSLEDENSRPGRSPHDFLDMILMRTDARRIRKKSKRLTSEYALYELEDLLGGHTAVSCFWARVLVLIAPHPDIQRTMQEEVDSVLTATGDDVVRLKHRALMPYTQAVILESLRMTTSPVVPHVAMEDSSIGGYSVKKDTVIFINNYYLNTSTEFWNDPDKFDPSRFLTLDGRQLLPPEEHFMPFSLGKRSCMGFQLLQSITFLATSNLLRQFDVMPSKETRAPPVEPAKLSVYDESVRVIFRGRFQ